eukprot:Pgem_evm1s11512
MLFSEAILIISLFFVGSSMVKAGPIGRHGGPVGAAESFAQGPISVPLMPPINTEVQLVNDYACLAHHPTISGGSETDLTLICSDIPGRGWELKPDVVTGMYNVVSFNENNANQCFYMKSTGVYGVTSCSADKMEQYFNFIGDSVSGTWLIQSFSGKCLAVEEEKNIVIGRCPSLGSDVTSEIDIDAAYRWKVPHIPNPLISTVIKPGLVTVTNPSPIAVTKAKRSDVATSQAPVPPTNIEVTLVNDYACLAHHPTISGEVSEMTMICSENPGRGWKLKPNALTGMYNVVSLQLYKNYSNQCFYMKSDGAYGVTICSADKMEQYFNFKFIGDKVTGTWLIQAYSGKCLTVEKENIVLRKCPPLPSTDALGVTCKKCPPPAAAPAVTCKKCPPPPAASAVTCKKCPPPVVTLGVTSVSTIDASYRWN